ncbi:MAG: ADP-ribosylation factor-like protein [Candidatus Hodarchaeales archaeon]|jgi:signal recognition particle receptor subunit beta
MMTTDFEIVKRDHQGVPVVKIVFWGPTLAGKTTALTITKVLKSLEDPENVYKFLKLEDPTGRTLFFDQGIFGIGKTSAGLPILKYHLFTVPGQERHAGQRKVVLRGAHGLIAVVDSERSRWEENKQSLQEIKTLAGDKLASGALPYFIMLNKMDLPKEQRISSLEVGKLLSEAGVAANLRDAAVRIVEVSCLDARDDLKNLLSRSERSKIVDANGRLRKDVRPNSVTRVIKSVETLIREIIILMMKQQQ